MSDAELRARIEELFDAALELPPAERDAFLRRACGDDASLRSEVDALLAANDRAGGLLDGAPLGAARALAQPALPARIGPYRVVSELGSGGMGVVLLAVRDDGQFRREVAIKVIRTDADVVELHRRFRAERQILASLSHPNIARLLDGGIDDVGRPYLVMEYVDGLPLDDYCERHRLGVADRLRLFCTIAHAVHHAHRNLVVHRDLKPSNILVDGDGVPKLLDFGIAKILDPSLVEDSQLTRTGLRPMTPAYASPEQVRGDLITTAADVYTLGVILYELLTGRVPFRARGRHDRELERRILEEEPLRPSLAVLRNDTDQGGATRPSRSHRLHRLLRGDLDRIVLMAMHKEPERRYASAEQMVEDIQRHLAGLPVIAHTDAGFYRVRKFVRRRWLESAAALVTTLSLIAGATVALWQSSAATRERDSADAARVNAEQALQQSRAMTGFLMSLFDASQPGEASGDSVPVRELLERGLARAERLQGQPAAQAQMYSAVADVYLGLGRFDKARELHERALALRRQAYGEVSAEVGLSLERLAATTAHRSPRDRPVAESLYVAALEVQRASLGENHLHLASTHIGYGRLLTGANRLDAAESHFRRALEIRLAHLEEGDSLVVQAMTTVAAISRRRGNIDAAESWLRRAIDASRRAHGENVALGDPMLRLADLLREHRGRPAEAESLFRATLDLQRRLLGDGHPSVAATMRELSTSRRLLGDLAGAESLSRQSLAIRERVYGAEHGVVAEGMDHLAQILRLQGRYAEALALLRRSLEMERNIFGPDHGLIASTLASISRVLTDMGEYREAEALCREQLDVRRRVYGDDHPLIALTLAQLGEIRARAGDRAGAEHFLKEALDRAERGYGIAHYETRRIHSDLASLYDGWRRPQEASRHRELATPPPGP